MRRDDIRAHLDTLTRNELIELATALVFELGVDATARLRNGGPFRQVETSAQLMLVAVDTRVLATELERIWAYARAVLRLEASSMDELGKFLNDPNLRKTLKLRWQHMMREASRAVAYDCDDGLRLLADAASGLDSIERSRELYFPNESESAGLWGFAFEDFARALGDTLGSAVAAVVRKGPDASRVDALATVAALCARYDAPDATWHKLAPLAAANGGPKAILDQAAERNAQRDASLGALSLLAAVLEEPDADRFVEVTERWALEDPTAILVLADGLEHAGRIDEARFWAGEGRARFPHHAGWDELEDRLF